MFTPEIKKQSNFCILTLLNQYKKASSIKIKLKLCKYIKSIVNFLQKKTHFFKNIYTKNDTMVLLYIISEIKKIILFRARTH